MREGLRIVLAKPGLDGHDRGIKVIAMALRDAGADVAYLGLRCTPAEIAAAAVERDATSSASRCSPAPTWCSPSSCSRRWRLPDRDTPIVVGGTVPEGDAQLLKAMGVADVLPVGTALDEVVSRIVRIASEPAALR